MNNRKKRIAATIIFLIFVTIMASIFYTAFRDITSGKPNWEHSNHADKLPVPAKEEETLLTITQATAGHQMETYVYVDMDHDGAEELIGTYRDDNDIYQTWYCSSDGRTCQLIHQNDGWMDGCNIELLEFDSETHVVMDAYCLFGTSKNYTVIAFKDNVVSCLLSNKYGYVRMTESGDITLDVEAYDAMYDADLGFMIGHTWNDTYLYFDGEVYREYGATEITESEYLRYENSQTLKDMIANTLEQPDTVKTEFSYFIRKNGFMHIQCNIYNDLGTIKYGYYTIRFSDGVLDDQLGEYTEGHMSSHFSDLEVTY